MSVDGERSPESGASPAGLDEAAAGRLKRQIQACLVTHANDALPLSPLALQTLVFPHGLYAGAATPSSVLQAFVRHGGDASSEIGKDSESPTPASGTAVLDARVLEMLRRTAPVGGAPMPLALEAAAVRAEQQRVEAYRRKLRIAELESRDTATLTTREKIELQALRLHALQRRVRQEVVAVSRETRSVDAYVDRNGVRRNKKMSLRELRMLERMEQQQRKERTKRDRQQYSDHLAAVAAMQRDLQAAWRASVARRTRLTRLVAQHHANVEREDAKRRDRNAKERLRALKADDEEAYLRLIDEQKDTRITYLLRQTDEFLGNLTEKVRAQQAELSGGVALPIDAPTSPTTADGEDAVDYFSIAHRVREEVTEQPRMLTGGKLKEYQLRGLQWMVSLYNNNLNGILADEMGLGKTIQTISLIAHLVEQKAQAGPYLVVVPLSTMANWSIEFERWAPSLVRVEYKGPPAARKALAATVRAGRFNVLLTTYEYIIKDKAVLSKPRWLYLVVDEGHRMKNAHSKLVTTLGAHYSTRLRLILTGTPLQNNLPELWALLNFLLPRVFNSCKTFEEWFNAPFANTGEAVELNEEEMLLIIRRLHKVLRPFLLRRMKRDVEAELPDKVEYVLRCPMSALQQSLYASVAKSSAAAFAHVEDASTAVADAQAIGIRRLNNTIMQLRKICNHPFVFDEVEAAINPRAGNNALLFRAAGKFELLDRMLPKLRATGHKTLIFFQMTQIMTIMEDLLAMRGIPYLRLDGSTKAEERTDFLARFNAPDSPYAVFLLSTRAGGLGLNLQSADTVVIFDSDWNPHQDLQAQDRAHRIGQTKEVRIYRMVTTSSVEEYILQRAQHKLSLDGKVIQAGKFDQKSTNEEREAMLRAIMEREDGDKEEDDDKEGGADAYYGDDELNEILARNEDEMAVFRRVDEERMLSDRAVIGSKPRLLTTEELPAAFVRGSVTLEGGAGPSTSSGTSSTVSHMHSSETLGVRNARLRAMTNADNDDDEAWMAKNNMLVDADEGDAVSPAKRKKSGTTLKLKIPRRKTEDLSESDGESLSNPASPAEVEAMRRIFAKIENCTDENDVDEEGTARYRSDLFLELPERSLYPDYYAVIRRPICLSAIESRISRDGARPYASLDAFAADMRLLFANALRYNADGSQVHADAQHMSSVFESELEREKSLL